MTKAQCVGEDGGRDQSGMEMKHNAHSRPGQNIDTGEGRNNAHGRERYFSKTWRAFMNGDSFPVDGTIDYGKFHLTYRDLECPCVEKRVGEKAF